MYTTIGSAAATSLRGGPPFGGCELWIARSLKACDQDIITLHSSPKLLIVRVRLAACSLLLVVGHAPTSDLPENVIANWWRELAEAVDKLARPTDSVVCMIEANARVGSEVSVAIGPAAAGRESFGGACMHQFLV